MRQLMFKSRFVPMILDGSKTQTIRLSNKLRVGDLVRARNGYNDSGFGVLRVLEVRELHFSELTEADAVADGFETLISLKDEIKRLFPASSASRVLFCIRFEYMGSLEQIRAELDRQGSLALDEPLSES